MKFKVGDKVKLTREITQDDLAEIPILLHAYEVIKELGCNIFEVKDISEENVNFSFESIYISLPSNDWWLKSEWFELAEPQGVNESPPKLRGVEFRKVRVEIVTHCGMVSIIRGYAKEKDLDFNCREFLKIYNEPKTKSGFTMIKVTSVLSIYAEEQK